MTKWQPKNDSAEATALQIRGKKVPRAIVQILQNRGYKTPQAIEKFFAPSLSDLHDPFLLHDMEKAVTRINRAIGKKEKVLIHGDYDTDGITGTALLVRNLRKFGLDVQHYIPHRIEEGYGLSSSGINRAIEEKCTLMITVDCGSGAINEIARANSHNIDVIVCDHHQPKDNLPDALAIINPKLPGSKYPFKELAGVGVAFKLLAALQHRTGKPMEDLYIDLDLVALGTVVDVVPLVEENRILAKYGMKRILRSTKKGIQALLKETGISKELNSYHLSFIIGPRINACGRLHDAKIALELLLTEDMPHALKLAHSLTVDNEERKKIQDEMYANAVSIMKEENRDKDRIIVLAGDDWHEGVLGIVASRIATENFRPTIILTMKQDTAKGSARSIPGFDITEAIGTCSALLNKFGGHTQAAGLEMNQDNLERFRTCINEHAQNLDAWVFEKQSYYDARLGLDEITSELVHFLKYFEPTGIANPQPVFLSENLEVVGVPRVIGTNHLKISLRQGKKVFPAIAFERADEILGIEIGKTRVNCLYSLAEDSYLGKKKTSLKVKELEKIA
ncbi:MAG: single-stranded-DNA-specific exonuclease RecJ [candidate division WOR-3 bacterium]|nr:MAG: single-stranded-DNA-specific exonuclease RecJ [candidate division WOR-3 bacterium]